MAANLRSVATDSIDDLRPITTSEKRTDNFIGWRPLRGTVRYLLGITAHLSPMGSLLQNRDSERMPDAALATSSSLYSQTGVGACLPSLSLEAL